jgi:hypothetical protein
MSGTFSVSDISQLLDETVRFISTILIGGASRHPTFFFPASLYFAATSVILLSPFDSAQGRLRGEYILNSMG